MRELYIFETEFGTSFATVYDIEALAATVESQREIERAVHDGGGLFPDPAEEKNGTEQDGDDQSPTRSEVDE